MEKIAIYMRLSKEDNRIQDESNSITNQRAMLKRYIRGQKDLINKPVVEFVDDGISGKTVNRPGLQEMLEGVKKREITTILVKDISRFSRDYPIKYKECNAFEVFVKIPVYENENYYCSNYGRIVNNYRKKNFHLHKEGNVHVTIFDKNNDRAGDYYTEKLVAMCFLKKPDGRYNKVWHKDGNINNCWYKNLIYVTDEQYSKLKDGKITVDDLHKQEYTEFRNNATYKAYHVYDGIKKRCSDAEGKEECYNGAVLCDEWSDDPKAFVKWYLEHYYTVDDESMAVDKDLFGNGSKVYSPENCCVVPQGINTMLSNCKKPYYKEDYGDALLPFGVKKCDDGYFGSIKFMSNGNQIRLSTFDIAEEAFQEYKIMKKADVLLMAAKYKDKIPDYIYQKLLELEIEPY